MAGSLTLSFDVAGDQQVARGFSRFADNVKDLSEPFREIVKDFFSGERRQFETAGGYGAGGWEPLAPSTVEDKIRKGYPLDILVRTGALRESLTGGAGRIEEIRPLEAKMGTIVDYAIYHQQGRGVPERAVIRLPEEQKARWHKIVHRYLVKEARRVG